MPESSKRSTASFHSQTQLTPDKISNKIFELIAQNKPDVLAKLLDNKYCPTNILSIPNATGDTPLHAALLSGRLTLVNAIISTELFKSKHSKKVLKLQNNAGDTPLHTAVRTENVKLVEAITHSRHFKEGLCHDIINNDNQTAFDLARIHDMQEPLTLHSVASVRDSIMKSERSTHSLDPESMQASAAKSYFQTVRETTRKVPLRMIPPDQQQLLARASSQTADLMNNPYNLQRMEDYADTYREIRSADSSWGKAILAAMLAVVFAALFLFCLGFGAASYGMISVPLLFTLMNIKVVESAVVGGVTMGFGMIASFSGFMASSIFGYQSLSPSKYTVSFERTDRPQFV